MTVDRTFDRIPSPVSRSAAYPLLSVLPNLIVRSYSWRYVQLDQGREGACVAFDTTMEAAARPKTFYGDPVKNPPNVDELNRIALTVYERCRVHDNHRFGSGATQLAGMKAGVDFGFWKGYLWATGTPEQKALQTMVAIRLGPVCFASDWHEGMSWPTTPGVLEPTGPTLGGHSYLLSRVDAKKGTVWTPNSWGGSGQGELSHASLVTLFANGAEAGFPVWRRLAPSTPKG